MKKITLVLLILVIVGIGIGFFLYFKKSPSQKSLVVGGNSGIVILSLGNSSAENAFFPLEITGYITGQENWNAFEGQAGTVKLLDGNGKELANGILTATTDWMKSPVFFKTTLNFYSLADQEGSLVFKNENASGLPEKDNTFNLPIKIKKSQQELMTVKAYFSNNKLDPEISCNKVFPVERIVPKTDAVGTSAIEELLKGPTEAEKKEGYYTSINDRVVLQSLMIGMDSGTAFADFNQKLQEGIGGSCKVSAIRSQITETLKQFSTIKSVLISINGETETILQP